MDNLEILKEKCLLYYQFLIENTNMPAALFEESKKLVEKAFAEKKIARLKAASRDIDSHVRGMPLLLAMKFKGLLKAKLDIDYTVIDKARTKAIEKIMARGAIVKEEEYRLVIDRLDEIYANADNEVEANILKNLLVKYEYSKDRKER